MKVKKNEKLIERFSIENTPFTSVLQDGEHRLTLGQYLMTKEKFNSIESVKDYIEKHKWELITTIVSIVANSIIHKIKE